MEVKIYTLSYCPFCEKAKSFLEEREIEFEEEVCDDNKEDMKKQNVYPTFPQVFINEELIGGYDDLIQKANEGIFDEDRDDEDSFEDDD